VVLPVLGVIQVLEGRSGARHASGQVGQQAVGTRQGYVVMGWRSHDAPL
jgi:hypothetical protein